MKTDEELLRAFAAGEPKALGELAERYEPALLNLAAAHLGSAEAAVDAVQEVWLRVIRYAASFNGRSSLKTWLYRIAINQCRTMLAATRAAPEGPLRDLASPDDPAAAAVRSDGNARLKAEVEALSAEQREVILLCYTQGLSHVETAEALGIPIGTVKSRLHAALEQLRTRITS